MVPHRSNYLINQLLDNKLSRAEFDEFLAGLHSQDTLQTYSEGLGTYFNELLNQHEHPPEPEPSPERTSEQHEGQNLISLRIKS